MNKVEDTITKEKKTNYKKKTTRQPSKVKTKANPKKVNRIKETNIKRKNNHKDETIKIIPLGGLGEIGKNMTAVEVGNDIYIIDAGLTFPDETMLGIDIVIPDMNRLDVIAMNDAFKLKELYDSRKIK